MTNFKIIEEFSYNDCTGSTYKINNGPKVIALHKNKETICSQSFIIGVKTKLKNNKGISHILEHMVLEGSKRYRERNLFNNLSQKTSNTYLNAITYKEHTVYLGSSNEDESFKEIFQVYMDCVINPLNEERVFLIEGLNKKISGTDISYNGIVYNESRGYYSNIKNLISGEIYDKIYGNSFKYSNIGKEEEIKKVNFFEIIDYHNKNYNIEDFFFLFFGKKDINEQLKLIEKYIDENKTNKRNKRNEIGETLFLNKQKNISIEIPMIRMGIKDTYRCLAYVFKFDTYYEKIKMDILIRSIFRLYSREIKEGCVSYIYDSDLQQPTLIIYFKNTKIDCFKKSFEQIVKKTLKEKDILLDEVEKEIFKTVLCDYGYKPEGIKLGLDILDIYENYNFKEGIDYKKYFNTMKRSVKKNKLYNFVNKHIFYTDSAYNIYVEEEEKKITSKKHNKVNIKVKTTKLRGYTAYEINYPSEIAIIEIVIGELNLTSDEEINCFNLAIALLNQKYNILKGCKKKLSIGWVREEIVLKMKIVSLTVIEIDINKEIEKIKLIIDEKLLIEVIRKERIRVETEYISNMELYNAEESEMLLKYKKFLSNEKKSFYKLFMYDKILESKIAMLSKKIKSIVHMNIKFKYVNNIGTNKKSPIKEKSPVKEKNDFNKLKNRYTTKSEINYNYCYIKLNKKEFKYIYLKIVGTIINNYILCDKIRNENGAYTTGFKVYKNQILFYSKDDPNHKESFDFFKILLQLFLKLDNLNEKIEESLNKIIADNNKKINIVKIFDEKSEQLINYDEFDILDFNSIASKNLKEEIVRYIQMIVINGNMEYQYLSIQAHKE